MLGLDSKIILSSVGITIIFWCYILGRSFFKHLTIKYLIEQNITGDIIADFERKNISAIDFVKNDSYLIDKDKLLSDNEFIKDHVPPRIQESNTPNETIHICITIGGLSAAQEATFLLKSVFIHALRNDIHFHLLITDDAKRIIQKLFSEFANPAVNIFYEFVKFDPKFIKRKSDAVKVQITHHSGLFGMSKAFMYIIFDNVDKCLILDTDLVFGCDPYFLWSHFDNLLPPFVGMLKLGTSDSDMCSGVMLQRFSQMRKNDFENVYRKAIPDFCRKERSFKYVCRFGDQSMFYAVKLKFPLFKNLEDSWTLELCHEFRGHRFKHWRENDDFFFGIAHFNCLQYRRHLQTLHQFMERYKSTNLGRYLQYLNNLNLSETIIGNGKMKYIL